VAGVVDDDIEAAAVGDDLRDRRVDGSLRGDVELEGAQVEAVLDGVFVQPGDLGRVAAQRFAHAGIDRVAGMGQGAGGQQAEAARGAGDDDDVFHECVSFTKMGSVGSSAEGRDQTNPPLARST